MIFYSAHCHLQGNCCLNSKIYRTVYRINHFFLIDTHDAAQTGFWVNEQALMDRHYWIDGDYKVEIVRALQPAHQRVPHNYKITRLASFEDDRNVLLLEYDGIHKKI